MIVTRFCTSCLVLSIMAFVYDARVQAQDASEFMAEALGKVAGAVRLISDKTPYGYDENISLLGGYIRAGQFLDGASIQGYKAMFTTDESLDVPGRGNDAPMRPCRELTPPGRGVLQPV
jgi:hypothetical protein